jgi:hypothetical protein
MSNPLLSGTAVKKTALAIVPILVLAITLIVGAKAAQFDYSQFQGLPYDPPIVTLVVPSQNAIYNVPNVPLNVTVQIRGWIYGNIEQVRLLNYSLDGQTSIALTLTVPSMYGFHVPYNVYGDNMLAGLTDGNHNLIIYGETFIGGMTCYFNETVSFKVDTSPTPTTVLFPITLVVSSIIVIAVIAIVGVGLAIYFKRHKSKVA